MPEENALLKKIPDKTDTWDRKRRQKEKMEARTEFIEDNNVFRMGVSSEEDKEFMSEGASSEEEDSDSEEEIQFNEFQRQGEKDKRSLSVERLDPQRKVTKSKLAGGGKRSAERADDIKDAMRCIALTTIT